MFWRYRPADCCSRRWLGWSVTGGVFSLPLDFSCSTSPAQIPEADSPESTPPANGFVRCGGSRVGTHQFLHDDACLSNVGGATMSPNHVTGQKEVARDSV